MVVGKVGGVIHGITATLVHRALYCRGKRSARREREMGIYREKEQEKNK